MTSRHKIYQQQSRKSVQTKRNSHFETLTPKETLRDSKTQPVSNQHNIQFANFPPRATIDNVSRSSVVQSKLQIGEVGDKYEQEADRVAKATIEQINAPDSQQIQRDILPQPEEELQMKPLAENRVLQAKPIPTIRPLQTPKISLQAKNIGGEINRDLEDNIHRAKSGGQSLAPDLQAKMGQTMGADFSNVKIHTDTDSDRLNQSLQAKAFTTGNHVFFKKGEYNPTRKGGQELIAHELTHVVQQNGGAVQRKTANIQIVQCNWFTKNKQTNTTTDNPTDILVRLNYFRVNIDRIIQSPPTYRPILEFAKDAACPEAAMFLYDYLRCRRLNSEEGLQEQLYNKYIRVNTKYEVNLASGTRLNLRNIAEDPNRTFQLDDFRQAYGETKNILKSGIAAFSKGNKRSLFHPENYNLLCEVTDRIGYPN